MGNLRPWQSCPHLKCKVILIEKTVSCVTGLQAVSASLPPLRNGDVRKSPEPCLRDPGVRGTQVQGGGRAGEKEDLSGGVTCRLCGSRWMNCGTQLKPNFKLVHFRKLKAENSCSGGLVMVKKRIPINK